MQTGLTDKQGGAYLDTWVTFIKQETKWYIVSSDFHSQFITV